MAFREGRVRYQYKYWLGYRKGQDGKPEIVPEEAETIRRIYRMFLDGHSMKQIAERMTVENAAPHTGAAPGMCMGKSASFGAVSAGLTTAAGIVRVHPHCTRNRCTAPL